VATNEPRVVVITGGTAGLGRAMAAACARRGWRVAVLARDADALAATRDELESLGADALALPVDVADAGAVVDAAGQVLRRWGRVDAWINNAMTTIFSPITSIAPEEYARVTAVTYLGTVHGTIAALRCMQARGTGVIVQIGSALSYRAIPLQSAYCGAKFAMRAFTDALRSELKHDGSKVRLTMLQLPAVNTPQFDWARTRMGRSPRPVPPVFQPEDIAEIVFKAARHAPREVWIGWPALKLIAGGIAVPGYLDRYLASAGFAGQATPETETDPEGNLFEAKANGHTARGRFSDEAKAAPMAFNPAWLRLGVVLGALAGAVILLMF